MTDFFSITNDPVLKNKFPILEAYDRLQSKHRWDCAQVYAPALASGEMQYFLQNPNRVEPPHIKRAIRNLDRKYYRQISSLINNWPDTRGDRKRK